MYYELVTANGQLVILRVEGDVLQSFLPNPDNTDYQRYLEWVAAGGIPEPWNGA